MTGIDLSKYNMTELALIKGIFEHEYDVVEVDGIMVATPAKHKGKEVANNG